MPTLGWRLEDDVERFWENHIVAKDDHKVPHQFACPTCGRLFNTSREREAHINLEHPLQLPKLIIHDKEITSKKIITRPISFNAIEILNTSSCQIQYNNRLLKDISIQELKSIFSKERDCVIIITLINKPNAIQKYFIEFKIMNDDILNEIDKIFIDKLAIDQLNHDYIHYFMEESNFDSKYLDYKNALANYALGIVMKDNPKNRRSSFNFGDFDEKMRSSLNILKKYNRTIPNIIANAIRLNLNIFNAKMKTNLLELEIALEMFRKKEINTFHSTCPRSQANVSLNICPIDTLTKLVIDSCNKLYYSENNIDIDKLEDILFRSSNNLVSNQDARKLHLICLSYYERSHQDSKAEIHRNRLQY
ncbi:hypothetical protein [Herpetosiphon geysericola]|uniref:C2H2-type domain-containing protein n=1 Tax=Herpetosiphon geysericola TaxID=70996 RepID=A0A0P6Y6G7_9CHLR|nr:hypothetical protein [Herpetosiphon geysericola]KPL91982.1 hypothetical protein SE18_00015 [Herpetosiphon geysericola]